MIRIKNFLIAFIFLSNLLTGQNKTIVSGKVKDNNGKPIAYANVFLLNTPDGTMSESDGSFEFRTSQKGKAVLIASIIGYEKYMSEIELNDNSSITLDVILKEKTIKLNETIITASSYGSEKEKGLVINRLDILTTPGGAADIYQSLKTMPGITQVSESAELYVRGGDPIESITIVNQSAVYHPYTFESSYGGMFSNLNQSVVKSMYFSSGGFSAKYGNALSGVLDIETKGLPKNTRVNIGASLANGALSADVAIDPESFGFYFDANKSFTKPIFWLNGGMDRLILAPNSKNFTGGVCYNYSRTGRLKFFTIIAEDEQGVIVDLPGYKDVFNGSSKNNFFNIQNQNIIFNNIIMKNSAAYNTYSNLWKLGILDVLKTDLVCSFRNDFEAVLFDKSKIIFGFEIESRKVKYLGTIQTYDYDLRKEAESKIINSEFMNFHSGFYSEFQFINVLGVDNLSATAGARYDNFIDLKVDWIDPRLGMSYKLGHKSMIRFACGIFRQIPDARLYSPVDGNPKLKPMRADHFIASYEYVPIENIALRVEVYKKYYKNLPTEDKEDNYNNSGYGFADGVDVIYKGDFPFGIRGWISYGFINTKRRWMDYDIYTNSAYDITHNLSFVAKYNISERFQFGSTAKYATGKPYTPIISSKYNNDLNVYEPIYSQKNSDRFPDYKRIDVRLTYFGHIFDGYSLVAYIEGINILNFKNIFGFSYSHDYSEKNEIQSYFGQRMIVVGFNISF